MSAVLRGKAPAKVDIRKSTEDHECRLARKDSATCLSTGHLGPYELEATPISQDPNFYLPDQRAKQEESIALTSLPEKIVIQALKARHEQDNLIFMIRDWHASSYFPSTFSGLLQNMQDLHITERGQDSLSKSPPPPPLSHAEYLHMLADDGLDYITPYAEQLDANANYAVAPTADAKKKRCKVGRPRGKILRQVQGDNLFRRLCDFDKDREGFEIRLRRGENAMVCKPWNQVDDDPEE
jgi:hypothetical protein